MLALAQKKVGDFIESTSYNEHLLGAKRTMQYYPDDEDFVSINGKNRYTRALYGAHTAFRLETSDFPVFASYVKRNCKHIRFAIKTKGIELALDSVEHCEARYHAGRRDYLITDPRMGKGELQVAALALYDRDGAIWKFQAENFEDLPRIKGVISEIRNSKLNRNGDMGVDPADSFEMPLNPKQMQTCESEIKEVLYVLLDNQELSILSKEKGKALFNQTEKERQKIASQLQIKTPDAYFNTLGGTIATAADGIWDGEVWMHGAIGWRMPLSGWRAAYTGDVLGWHDRARTHFDAYANSQVTDVSNTIPHPAQDTTRNFARSAKIWGTPQYSNGYICRNPNRNNQMHHYDMNLCYIDELLWHFNWTGDLDYVKKMWPVITRHLAWEKLNYDPNNDGLYDAYASIWASDALYYNSGAVTHSSAYNYRANKMAAQLAQLLGEDATSYANEAAKILAAINKRLWISSEGHWAEFEDFMGYKRLHESAGIWTIYHAIDGEIADKFQAYQGTRYIDKYIPHIPVQAKGLADEGYATISTTNWLPYSWSINNVAFSEVAHTALSYWQAGRNKEAFHLFKSSILDGMYIGNSPGNIGQLSFYDSARGECYRDFGDPVGTYSRAIVQGLFGIIPHALNGQLIIKPGFPSDWKFASIKTPDIYFDYKQDGATNCYAIETELNMISELGLYVRAEKEYVRSVTVNGADCKWKNAENVGEPLIKVEFPCLKGERYELKIVWGGNDLNYLENEQEAAVGESFQLNVESEIQQVFDPQQVFKAVQQTKNEIQGSVIGKVGYRTLFAQLKQGDIIWWQPINVKVKEAFAIENKPEAKQLQFRITNNTNKAVDADLVVNGKHTERIALAAEASSSVLSIPAEYTEFGTNVIQLREKGRVWYEERLVNWNLANGQPKYEMLKLDSQLNASVNQLFNTPYLTPCSPYTTLQIPTQGIGEWCHPLLTADIDDSGIRKAAVDNVVSTPMGIPFRTPSALGANNIIFTSLWDNFPNQVSAPLTGKALHAYFMMAGSTNHMQCHMINGMVTVKYKDGTQSVLDLIPPETWYPIEQDYFVNGEAFRVKSPRPYRVALKTAKFSRDMEKDMGVKPSEVYGRNIDGGAGVILDLPLDENKELESLELKAKSNDVVIGLMGVTLLRQ